VVCYGVDVDGVDRTGKSLYLWDTEFGSDCLRPVQHLLLYLFEYDFMHLFHFYTVDVYFLLCSRLSAVHNDIFTRMRHLLHLISICV